MSDVKPVAIKATAFWACLKDANKLSGKYQIDLGQLSPQAVELLQSMGIKVNDKGDDRGDQRQIFAFPKLHVRTGQNH